MYLEQLTYLIEVYRTGTLAKAAQKCHVTIPGISQSISSLEEELGVKIFKRSRQGVTPTIEGLKIIKKAYEVIVKWEELKEEAKPQNLLNGGELNLSASPSLIILLLKSAQAFKKDYPNVKIEITENTAPDVIVALEKNKIDIGFTAINQDILNSKHEWDYEILLKSKRYVCVNKHSPLALNDSIKPQELLNQPLVVYSGIYLKSFVYDFFKKYGEMNILFESNQLEIIKKTIAEGLAVSFLNNLLLRNDPRVINGEIVPIPLDDLYEETTTSFGWIRLKNSHFSYASREFLKYVKAQIKQGNY